jgi:hypothetical protein
MTMKMNMMERNQVALDRRVQKERQPLEENDEAGNQHLLQRQTYHSRCTSCCHKVVGLLTGPLLFNLLALASGTGRRGRTGVLFQDSAVLTPMMVCVVFSFQNSTSFTWPRPARIDTIKDTY